MGKLLLSVLVIGMILLRPQEAVNGGQLAMRVWFASVAPSVFPFLAMMPALISADACRIYDKLFSGWMQRLFHLPGAAASAMVTAMISGSPGGALAACGIARESGMRKDEAQRLALAMCGMSPAYLLLGVGCGLYDSMELGWKLILLQLGIQLILLFALRWVIPENRERCTPDPGRIGGGVTAAVETVLGICGYMVVFGAISSVVKSFAGREKGMLLQLLMDLPGGSAALAESGLSGKLPLQCAALGCGGLCIAAQNMDILKKIDISWGQYLAVRGIAAAFFACGGLFLISGNEVCAPGMVFHSGILPFFVLAASFLALPGLIFREKNLFLNKTGSGKN